MSPQVCLPKVDCQTDTQTDAGNFYKKGLLSKLSSNRANVHNLIDTTGKYLNQYFQACTVHLYLACRCTYIFVKKFYSLLLLLKAAVSQILTIFC